MYASGRSSIVQSTSLSRKGLRVRVPSFAQLYFKSLSFMEKLRIVHANNPGDLMSAHRVRTLVFQQEQGIAQEADFDGLDTDPNTLNFVAYLNDLNPVGTARVRLLDKRTVAKIERVAVLASVRGKRVGFQIMEAIEEYLAVQRVPYAFLDSQASAKPFYEKLGYRQGGDSVDEVGIPHVKMVKQIDPQG